jgi:hypothetical protein
VKNINTLKKIEIKKNNPIRIYFLYWSQLFFRNENIPMRKKYGGHEIFFIARARIWAMLEKVIFF